MKKTLVNVCPQTVGARNELVPTNPPPEPIKVYTRTSKPIIIQRIHIDEDINVAKNTPLYPPYQNYDESFDRLHGAVHNHHNDKLIA